MGSHEEPSRSVESETLSEEELPEPELKPINVCFRTRPMNATERRHETSVLRFGGRTDDGNDLVALAPNPNINKLDPQAVCHTTGKTYGCDRFFDSNQKTEAVYEATAKNLVKRLFDGRNGSAFCYGPTGTGKTFTMFGDEAHPGIVRLVGMDLFEAQNEEDHITQKIKISGVEIYGELLRDLMNSISDCLTIQNTKHGTRIKNLSDHYVETYSEYVALVEQCRSARITQSTSANAVSSRSHCIIQINLKRHNKVTGESTISKLNLIDLAGSERATVTDEDGKSHPKSIEEDKRKRRSKTPEPGPRRKKKKKRARTDDETPKKKTKPKGKSKKLSDMKRRSKSVPNNLYISTKSRLGECCDINSSLLALKKCIRCLVKHKKHIPWRESKLTRLLEDTLQGDGSAYMIVCLSKGSAQWMATRDTLEYGSQARMIKVGAAQKKKVRGNEIKYVKEMLQKSRNQNMTLYEENDKLQKEIEKLRKLLAEKDKRIQSMTEDMDQMLRE